MLLQDRVAIVTGAGQALGGAIAQALAGAGARVALADLNPDRVERVAQTITALGGAALAIAADVSNKFQSVHVVETTRAAWGRLDIVVNAISGGMSSSILQLDEWAWNREIEVQLKSVFLMSQLCGRVMAWENAGRGGVILNLGRAAGAMTPGRAAYYASKAGVVAFTAACAVELAAYSVRVNCLLINDALAAGGEAVEGIPTPADVAQAALWLCSDAARGVSGASLTVDGGLQWLDS